MNAQSSIVAGDQPWPIAAYEMGKSEPDPFYEGNDDERCD